MKDKHQSKGADRHETLWSYGYRPERALGESLKELRTAGGMSQEYIATMMSRAGFSWRQTTVAKTEAGNRPVRLDEAAALALHFGVSVNELIDNQADTPEQSKIESKYRVAFSMYLSSMSRVEEAVARRDAAEVEYQQALNAMKEREASYEQAKAKFDQAFGTAEADELGE
ncbi:hypothetical protein GCM10009854_27790 [Saccharopolyspora halophila]|uniref:HTH cro/C1-type domain-containing protein n=1 Tax=Saccharopolyspora halophila TaxID=405551 RepID=A0ABP5TB00_9PSEU